MMSLNSITRNSQIVICLLILIFNLVLSDTTIATNVTTSTSTPNTTISKPTKRYVDSQYASREDAKKDLDAQNGAIGGPCKEEVYKESVAPIWVILFSNAMKLSSKVSGKGILVKAMVRLINRANDAQSNTFAMNTSSEVELKRLERDGCFSGQLVQCKLNKCECMTEPYKTTMLETPIKNCVVLTGEKCSYRSEPRADDGFFECEDNIRCDPGNGTCTDSSGFHTACRILYFIVVAFHILK